MYVAVFSNIFWYDRFDRCVGWHFLPRRLSRNQGEILAASVLEGRQEVQVYSDDIHRRTLDVFAQSTGDTGGEEQHAAENRWYVM